MAKVKVYTIVIYMVYVGHEISLSIIFIILTTFIFFSQIFLFSSNTIIRYFFCSFKILLAIKIQDPLESNYVTIELLLLRSTYTLTKKFISSPVLFSMQF